jgi:very-short-patch-repair endonuclease
VFRGRLAVSAGLLTPAQLRSRAWRRLFQGVYVDSSVDLTHRHRCAVALAFCLPTGSVIAGRSAAVIYGIDVALDAVEALIPRGIRLIPYAGLNLHQVAVDPGETRRVDGLAVTDPARTCWDLACWFDPVEAVVFVDRMLGLGVTTSAELERYLKQRLAETPPARGIRRYARVVSLADGNAGSPQESRLRARLMLAGLPRPQTQVSVFDRSGRFVARVDLAWPELKVAVEYDGLWHAGSPEQIHADRKRLNALVGLGWTVLHVTHARLRDDFDAVVREIRSALRRRGR